jgi:predicted metal-dependent phosphoesterase TrpH
MQAWDLHVHTDHSADCRITVQELLAAARQRKLGIAITDHNEISGSLLAARQHDVKVLPGIEVTSAEHIDFLCYFETPRDLSAFFELIKRHRRHDFLHTSALSGDAILKAARTHHGVVALAHPHRYALRLYDVWRTMPRITRFFRLVDAVEGVNGRTFQFLNERSIREAGQRGKPLIAGSDSHHLADINGACTLVPDGVGILDAIRRGKTRVRGKGDKVVQKLWRSARTKIFGR